MFSLSNINTTVRPFILPERKSPKKHCLVNISQQSLHWLPQINHVIAQSEKSQFYKKLFKIKVSHAMPKLRPVDAKTPTVQFIWQNRLRSNIFKQRNNRNVFWQVFCVFILSCCPS